MMELFGPNFAYGYLFAGVIIGFIVGRVTAPKAARDVGGGRPPSPSTNGPARPAAAATGTVEFEIEGRRIQVDPASMAEIRRFIAQERKIEAIKHLREATGLGLAEAKGLVEAIERMDK